LTLKAGYLFPTNSTFKDVYEGGVSFGGDLTVPIAGALHLWTGAEMFGKTGFLTLTEEETKVRIVPLFIGLRGYLSQASVRPYLGAATSYFILKEENPLGTISEGGFGFIGQVGLLLELSGPLALDVFASYRACTLRTDEEEPVTAKLDGLAAGLGLSFRF
jgi:outer membrane protein W